MSQTKELIVQASNLPTSVIIVGVGNEEFELMEELDCDNGILTSDSGRQASRDIVQFVKFKEAKLRGNLAEEVLKEVPEQLCLYMESIGYVPVKPQIPTQPL